MNSNPDHRPNRNELYDMFEFWDGTNYENYKFEKRFGYYGNEIRLGFKEANKDIPNISVSYEKDPDAIYISRAFTFTNLPKPVNSPLIAPYLQENEEQEKVIKELVQG
ncbi:5901_t:CDS:2 [Funneliformis mosseae]|uniref:5901_t:CDS:1 n=1 Tax=Funneliformis mosseae TaxID=27381 RepID=A0A9N9F7C6_FUNMO|nr:5901_t:CDS:2 [Funneliformis mosseae]